MSKFYLILLLCVLFIGCATLFTEQKYIPVEAVVNEKYVWSGVVFSIPFKSDIRKIVITGEGVVHNIDIYVRDSEFGWKKIKSIKRRIDFPIEIQLAAYTDAVRILQKTVRGKGRLGTVKFYTLAPTD